MQNIPNDYQRSGYNLTIVKIHIFFLKIKDFEFILNFGGNEQNPNFKQNYSETYKHRERADIVWRPDMF